MNVKYLFLIPRTPKQFRSDVRDALWELCKQALLNQKYTNWKAVIITDEAEEENEHLDYFIDTTAVTKYEKIEAGLNYIAEHFKPEYLIRLDDDDLMMPDALLDASTQEFDALTETVHSFYEVTSDLISQQKRDWFPNTMIHKYEHAVTVISNEGRSLLNHDHSQAWHSFYQGKKVVFTSPKQPLYVRILSPNSITSRGNDYATYVDSYGYWDTASLQGFEQYRIELRKIKTTYLKGFPVFTPDVKRNKIRKFKEGISNFLKR